MRKSIPILISLLFTAFALQGQTLTPSVISSGGGYFEGENMSISWTLGELAVTTLSSGDLILTQGFQQPFDLDVGTRDNNNLSWGISVYPNPVGDQLRIRFDISDPGDYLIEVQDVTGRLVSQLLYKQVNPGDIILLNTSGYATGVYFLKVMTGDHTQVQVTSLRKL
jgi:urease accessory protein UreH